jgi:pyruvate,orthophosphate dikinase
MTKKWVYLYDELDEAKKYAGLDWNDVCGLLGGKGATLAEMARIGLPVPPGFPGRHVGASACRSGAGREEGGQKIR